MTSEYLLSGTNTRQEYAEASVVNMCTCPELSHNAHSANLNSFKCGIHVVIKLHSPSNAYFGAMHLENGCAIDFFEATQPRAFGCNARHSAKQLFILVIIKFH